MITVLVSEINRSPMRRLLKTAGHALPKIRVLTYTQVFRRFFVPAGCVIFTDFDLLSDFELDAACAIAASVENRGAPSRVLNDPRKAKERFALLSHLFETGQNTVEVTRLQSDQRPTRYPLFIRFENGCLRPDFEMISSASELDAAIIDLTNSGRTLRGRMTASFETATDADGLYRKYGAFRIGDYIVPQHILRSDKWIVKSRISSADDAFVAEELAFVRDNPHRAALMKIFKAANIEFGRIDYTVRDGEIVVFEINMNPTFPRFRGGKSNRAERRKYILEGLVAGFESLDVRTDKEPIHFTPINYAERYLVLRREDIFARLTRLWHRARRGKANE
ncbi:hypothetical protein [Yoonia tamlensis]|nr:hypothetical protein [Yoonia tamlensis]